MNRVRLCLMFGMAAWLTLDCQCRADELASALLKEGGPIIKKLKDSKYSSVGVLKFRVQKGGGALLQNAGPINLNLARRLEIALALGNDVNDPLTLLRDASATAATVSGGNHLTAAGRTALFKGNYFRSFGAGTAEADVFLTGNAALSSDLKTVSVTIAAFDKKDKVQVVSKFSVAAGADTLMEFGESFQLRGVWDKGKPQQAAAAARQKKEEHPRLSATAAVKLEVLYNGKVLILEYRKGEVWLPEPKENDEVAIRVVKAASKGRIGVVLKVNGQNTLFQEEQPSLACSRWIMPADKASMTINGYQLDDNKAQKFKVLSATESNDRKMDYGEHTGTISLVVYGEGEAKIDPKPTQSQEDAVAKGTHPTKQPKNAAAQRAMLLYARAKLRGLVHPGEEVNEKAREVEFVPNPEPILAGTIRYYKVK